MSKKIKNQLDEVVEEVENSTQQAETDDNNAQIVSELQDVIQKKNDEIADLDDKYKRIVAEYDNFKKRTVREKENLYSDSVCDTVSQILPIIDNLERALNSFEDKESEYYKGVDMILRQTLEIFEKIGVEGILTEGETFNPELHNAVMHIEDENLGENVIAEEFQKGYKYKDKVIRYSMVKVAN